MVFLRTCVHYLMSQLTMQYASPGTELAKTDVKGTFCLIPISPLDYHLLAMEWRGGIFIDMCLPFGLRFLCQNFSIAR